MKYPAFISAIFFLYSCSSRQPEPVKLNVDACAHCKMPVADARFAAELITPKGKLYKFDDYDCVTRFAKENMEGESITVYFSDFSNPAKFVPAANAHFISGGSLKSPMNGNVAAFEKRATAEKFAKELGATMRDDISK